MSFLTSDSEDDVINTWLQSYVQLIIGELAKIRNNVTLPGMNCQCVLYEEIDYLSFPSGCDYYGDMSVVDENSVILILSIEKRPVNLAYGKENVILGSLGCDIYKVLFNNQIRRCLRCWLDPID